MTRNTQLPILHFLIVADTNYCSHFVEMFTVQFFYLKCYNQSCITHYAIYSNNYLSDKVLFKNKKDSKKVSSSNKKSYNLRELALTFQQNGVIMVRRLWMCRMFIQHYPAYLKFTAPFQPNISFLSSTLGILHKDCNWAVSFIFWKKKKKKKMENGNRRTRSPR